MKETFIENGVEYVRQGDYYIPNRTVPDETEYQIGKYGSLRRTFLKEHHNWLYSAMLMQGTLLKHLAEIDETCHNCRCGYGKCCSRSERISTEQCNGTSNNSCGKFYRRNFGRG